MSYVIVLDTNLIYNDFFLKSADIKKLLKYSRYEPIDLCITEFNYYEIIKKYRDSIRPQLRQVKNTKSELLKLNAISAIDFENLKPDTYVENYQNQLDEIIKSNDIKIISFPKGENVSRNIALKYFNNKKPFAENKPSFQDSIVWESIVEYYNNNKPENIVFISNNSKDFANKEKSRIHDDLTSDIEGILYFDSLSSYLNQEEDNIKEYFNDNYEYDELDLVNQLKLFFEENNNLQDTVNDLLINENFEGEYFCGWGTDGYIEDISITITEVSLDIEEYELLISFDIELDVSFNIETNDPSFERGDSGDGMLSESSNTSILINSSITYLLEEKKFTDYVELDTDFI